MLLHIRAYGIGTLISGFATQGTTAAVENHRTMVEVKITITKFTGVGKPTIVVSPPQIEPQGEPKLPLRLVHGASG